MEFKRFKSENPVWGYFQRSTNGERAKCDTCGTNISCKGGSTGGMRNHFYLKHKIQADVKKTKAHVPSLAAVSSTDKSRIDSFFRPKNSCEVLYEALLTIQPTSAETERAFSACGVFPTKLRSRLNDSTIDALFLI